ncbi:hypothetical protein B0H17DRAFT_1175610 [Mycena rosella]|uniref:Uncharacterized protein n=1 Tax=Mycena rosella TaxID=1033263 RepID=A0AAD7M7C4_MYCRO|nr:hypothetical protein B0H17DRAFT_1175610 [Mycena rosella]
MKTLPLRLLQVQAVRSKSGNCARHFQHNICWFRNGYLAGFAEFLTSRSRPDLLNTSPARKMIPLRPYRHVRKWLMVRPNKHSPFLPPATTVVSYHTHARFSPLGTNLIAHGPHSPAFGLRSFPPPSMTPSCTTAVLTSSFSDAALYSPPSAPVHIFPSSPGKRMKTCTSYRITSCQSRSVLDAALRQDYDNHDSPTPTLFSMPPSVETPRDNAYPTFLLTPSSIEPATSTRLFPLPLDAALR